MFNKRSLPTHLLLWAAALVTALPLLAHLAISVYNRPMLDDFCFAYDAANLGLFAHVEYMYNTWTGTYSSTFFQGIIGVNGLWQFTPMILIILWAGALLWAFYPFVAMIDETRLVAAYRLPVTVILSALLLDATVIGAPNVYQSLYWTSGAITYSLPVIIFTVNLGLFVRTVRDSTSVSLPYLALIAGLCVIAGGFSPFFAVLQVTIWSSILLGCVLFLPRTYRRAALIASLTAIGFSLIAFVIVLVAPGNAVRRARFPDLMPITEVMTTSIRYGITFILTSPYIAVMICGWGLTGSWLYRIYGKRIAAQRLFLISALAIEAVVVAVICGFFTGFYATNRTPPIRSAIVMQYFIMMAAIVIGLALGYGLTQMLARRSGTQSFRLPIQAVVAGGLIFVTISVLQMAQQPLNDHVALQTFATEWDEIETQLINAGPDDDIVIQPFSYDFYTMAGHDPISTDPGANGCVNRYYGIRGLRMADAQNRQ